MTIMLYDLVGRDKSRPFSPHSWKIRMALAHKGLAFETVPVRFTEIPELEGGVTKTIPLIRHGTELISDSYLIALYLEEKWPERPTLFGGEGGKRLTRLIEQWVQASVQPFIVKAIIMDIHDMLDRKDAEYFRQDRERSFGMKFEEIVAGRDQRQTAFLQSLEPLRRILKSQPFVGGEQPLFADYIIFSAFQFARLVSTWRFIDQDDPVNHWFVRCLALHDHLGESIAAAAE